MADIEQLTPGTLIQHEQYPRNFFIVMESTLAWGKQSIRAQGISGPYRGAWLVFSNFESITVVELPMPFAIVDATKPKAVPDERIQAWERIVSHPFFRSCFGTEELLIDEMIDALDSLMTVESGEKGGPSLSSVDDSYLRQQAMALAVSLGPGDPRQVAGGIVSRADAILAFLRGESIVKGEGSLTAN